VLRKAARLRLVHAQLDSAELLPAGQPALDGAAAAERKGDELADEARARVDAVEPRLVGTDEVVLGLCGKALAPGPARDGVHAPGEDLDGVRLPGRPGEREPERFPLVEGNDDPSPLAPTGRNGGPELPDRSDRETPEPGRQRIHAPVLGDA
jgi:hypothetical protein